MEICGDFECEGKNNCLRYFTNLVSIEDITGDDYALTVRDFGGRWGGWGKSNDPPHGPKGPEDDRDYNGQHDSYSFEK